MNRACTIGIDLGGTNIKAGLIDPQGLVEHKLSRVSDPQRGPEHVLADLAAMCDDLMRATRRERVDVCGVGIGTPGPLDFARGVILKAANLPGWVNVPVRDRLSALLRLPVMLENDANAAAFGEYWAGAGRDRGDMVMLTLGTGVGGGVIVDGRLLHGHFGNAAELGHMIVEPDGLPCPCGQRGCLEQYSSASGVARRVITAIESGRVSSLQAGLAAGYVPSSRDVSDAALAGDDVCGEIWREACRYLAVACVNIQHAFNPATIVLGGGLAEAGERLLAPIAEEFAHQTWSLAGDQPAIVAASLGYDAGIIGAGGLARNAPSIARTEPRP